MEDNKTLNTEEEVQEEKTYAQADIDRIVGERLARERAKYADYDELKAKAEKYEEIEEASKTELQKAQEKTTALQKELDAIKHDQVAAQTRMKVAEETGVPASLLTGDNEDSIRTQAAAILDFSNTSKKYPTVKDGGEVKDHSVHSTREQFAQWFEQNR